MEIRRLGVAAVLLAAAFGVPDHLAAGETEVKLAGEVVDLHCYLTRHGGEGKGPEHAGCANACISRGVSAGFLAKDGTLYALFDESMISPKEKVAGFAGKPSTATGVVIERDGVKALRLLTIEERRD